MSSRIFIIGAGGHGRAVAESILSSSEFELVGFIDDAYPNLERVWEFPVLGSTEVLSSMARCADAAIVAIGNNRLREQLHQRLHKMQFMLATVIHPKAIVSPRAVIGPGSAIMSGAIIGTEASLGEGVIINSGAIVDHHCSVQDFGHLGVGASMAGGTVLGRGAWMQTCTALGYGVRIEPYTVLEPGQAVKEK